MKIIKYSIILFVFCVTGFVVVNTVSKKKLNRLILFMQICVI